MDILQPTPRALRISRIGLQVSDLDAACAFYIEALGFSPAPHGAPRSSARLLRLGEQEIELIAPDAPGAPYPSPRAANDPWFQHFAIAVSDMAAAYQQLTRYGAEPISYGGPQRLPPSTGSVIAYKFRDPDGHPLELSYLPGSEWLRRPRAHGPFLGVDHTAVAVGELETSVAFYTAVLGFRLGGRSLNRGPEQDRLDGLSEAQVDIVSLETAGPGPHIELLHYRTPRPTAPRPVGASDIAATRTTVVVRSLPMGGAGSLGLSSEPADRGIRLRDPDGHRLELQVEGAGDQSG